MSEEQSFDHIKDIPSHPVWSSSVLNASGKKRTSRLRSIFSRVRRALPFRRKRSVLVILNPAAGQASPDLRLLNRLIHAAGYEWRVEITNAFGDGTRLARKACQSGISLVVAYGGDGTVMDVAAGMIGSEVPLGILPGGTGNALAKELLIPMDFASAARLLFDDHAEIRNIDVGRVGDRLFLLRCGVGLEAEIVRTADRALKDRIGPLAYVTAAVQAWSQSAISRYRLELDGRVVETEGLACIIANAATLGIPGINISPHIQIDDGLLDVIVIRRADLAELASLMASVIGAENTGPSGLLHWQCRELVLHVDPPQGIEADGEELDRTNARASVLPGALRVIVPGR